VKKQVEKEPAKGDTVNLDGGLDEHEVVQIYKNDQGQRVARIQDADQKIRVVDIYRIKAAD
jgi:hypothetical protein